MNSLALIGVGIVLALFVVWAVGRITMLKAQAKDGAEALRALSEQYGRLGVEKEALQTHCEELRQNLGAALVRQVQIMLTDDQVRQLARTIFELARPTGVVN